MLRSKFAVLFVLIYASSMLGQHSSAGGSGTSSGGHSGGGSSSGSSGGSGGSHASSQGGSHSGSSGLHNASGNSSNGRGSADASSRAARAAASLLSRDGSLAAEINHPYFVRTIDDKGKPVLVSRTTALEVQEMEKSGKSPAEIQKFMRGRSIPDPDQPVRTPNQPEKRHFFSFLRHPIHKQQPVAASDLKKRVCLHEGCPICASGYSIGRGGICVGPTLLAPNYCASGSYWGGASCRVLGAHLRGNTCLQAGQLELTAAKRKMEEAERNMQAACSHDAASHECSELNYSYQQAVGGYHLQQQRQRQAYRDCLSGNSFASLEPSLDQQ